jgi:hypothetical protein
LKLIALLFILFLLNVSVFQPTTAKIMNEMKRTTAMISFLPNDIDIVAIQTEQEEKRAAFFNADDL